jgi:TatD DNase family protein
MSFIDTHAHLAMLKHATLDEVLERAKQSGIEKMVSVSVDEPSWEANRDLSERFPHIYFTLGLHPHEAKHWADCKERMKSLYSSLKKKERCVAVGEMGLDFFYNHSERDTQILVLEEQLEIAKKWNLPVVIHCRDAFEETYSAVKKVGLADRGGVMHCFTGNKDQAFQAIDLGLKISFSGILTFKTANTIQEAAKAIPFTEIVLETDCPFLAPVPMRGKPNEPSYLPHTAHTLGALRGVSLEKVAEQTTANACRLFGI